MLKVSENNLRESAVKNRCLGSFDSDHFEKREPGAESGLEVAVAEVIEAYKLAVPGQDVDAFMQLYDPNVRVFDAWGVWSYEGAAAWRKAIEGWFSSLGSERVKVTVDDVQILGGQGLGVVSATFTYAGFSAEGKALRSMQNRLTWALKSEGAGWKIVHEHTSAPLGFGDGKAILQRQSAS
jgi:ketosteroid isomerase-like protein